MRVDLKFRSEEGKSRYWNEEHMERIETYTGALSNGYRTKHLEMRGIFPTKLKYVNNWKHLNYSAPLDATATIPLIECMAESHSFSISKNRV